MQSFTYTIKDRDGVHARPAGAIIKAANAYKCQVWIEAKGKKLSLKGGIFSLMGLGIRCGDEIRIECDGEDEAEAAAGLKKSFSQFL